MRVGVYLWVNGNIKERVFAMGIINELILNLNILHSHTVGAILATMKGKRVISISNAYIEYLEKYLFSPDGIDYNLEYTLPPYGIHSFDNWAKSNNYYIKLSRSINLQKKKDFYNFK